GGDGAGVELLAAAVGQAGEGREVVADELGLEVALELLDGEAGEVAGDVGHHLRGGEARPDAQVERRGRHPGDGDDQAVGDVHVEVLVVDRGGEGGGGAVLPGEEVALALDVDRHQVEHDGRRRRLGGTLRDAAAAGVAALRLEAVGAGDLE